MYDTLENKEKVARAFLKELRAWFVCDGVHNPTPDQIENGNDYYDANMAMDAAMRTCGVLPTDPDESIPLEDESFVDLFNGAWERAVEIATVEAAA